MEQHAESYLSAILLDRASAGLWVQPALPNHDLMAFRQVIRQRLNYELPDLYADILLRTDGIDSNGVVLYASKQYFQGEKFILQGLLEANLLLHAYAPNLDFIYFAESGMDLCRHSLQSSQFEVCTRVCLRAAVGSVSPTAWWSRVNSASSSVKQTRGASGWC